VARGFIEIDARASRRVAQPFASSFELVDETAKIVFLGLPGFFLVL
jgi:hypothetical protein